MSSSRGPDSPPPERPGTVPLHAEVTGPDDAPAIVLGASLGTTLEMWDGITEALAERYRVVRYDTRGHGRSPSPPGPYRMSDLADDVVALADALGLARFGYVGISLSGAVGQQLALDHGDRLDALVLCCTTARFADAATWQDRADLVRTRGAGALVEGTRPRWFPEWFLDRHPEKARRILEMLAATDPEGYAGCCGALEGFDAAPRLDEVAIPTRVVGADLDPTTPPAVTQALADAIPGADHVVLPEAAHLANLARPEAFVDAVRAHLDRHLGS